MRTIDTKEVKDLLAEWDKKVADFDPQKDLQNRVQNYRNWAKDLEKRGEKVPADQKEPTDLHPGPAMDPNRPGNCYASMIAPIAGFAVKGAIFHQGYNNCFEWGSANAAMYYQVFGKMITAWRGTFDDPQLPFCIVSLCTAGEPQTRENFLKPMVDAGPYIREAQYQTFLDFRNAGDKNIGFASSFDLRKTFYHPQIKIPVGERAAKWALATQSAAFKGNEAEGIWLPPSIKEVKIIDHTIRLTMSTDIRMKDESEDKMNGFAIAGNDRRFFPADINWFADGSKDNRGKPITARNILVLSSPFVPEPTHYRYAWARNPIANLTNSKQVPLPAQRSDDWILEETPVKFPTPPGMAAADAARPQRTQILKELELDDTERRIKEAEATLASLKEKYTEDKQAWEAKKAANAEKLKAAKGAAK
jgi:sialate O-acetylesterase